MALKVAELKRYAGSDIEKLKLSDVFPPAVVSTVEYVGITSWTELFERHGAIATYPSERDALASKVTEIQRRLALFDRSISGSRLSALPPRGDVEAWRNHSPLDLQGIGAKLVLQLWPDVTTVGAWLDLSDEAKAELVPMPGNRERLGAALRLDAPNGQRSSRTAREISMAKERVFETDPISPHLDYNVRRLGLGAAVQFATALRTAAHELQILVRSAYFQHRSDPKGRQSLVTASDALVRLARQIGHLTGQTGDRESLLDTSTAEIPAIRARRTHAFLHHLASTQLDLFASNADRVAIATATKQLYEARTSAPPTPTRGTPDSGLAAG